MTIRVFTLRAALIAGCAFAFSNAPALSQDASAVVATIGGTPVTEADLDMAANDLDQQFRQLPAEQRRAAALSALIDIRLLAQGAETAGIADTDDMKRRIAFLRDRALHNAFFKQEVVDKVTDDEVRARYDAEIAAMPAENEVRARHILVKTLEEALGIIGELDGGADFAKLAAEKSTDPGSGREGGDLGWFSRGRMVPEFEAAAFALDPGSYTKEPVQSQFGFHVIKVEDKRAVQPPSYEEVKDQVRNAVFQKRYFDLLKQMRAAAAVEISDPALKASIDAARAAEEQAQ
ncbi:MAG TPA: peptidylprolyl isomerase [Rhizobiaceae bacterium]|nr:peptidylprolyl isomerase [Rhizobiaceae bacterium]